MPDLSWTQIKFLLHKHGWKQLRQEGSHTIWQKNGRTERIAVGHGHSMGGGGLKEILGRFGISMETATESPKVKRARGGQMTKIGELFVKSVPEEGTFGRRLFDSRVSLGMSQAQLAKKLDVPQGTISAWERNSVSPFHRQQKSTKLYLSKFAEFFGWEDVRVIKSVKGQIVTEANGAIPVGVTITEKAQIPASESEDGDGRRRALRGPESVEKTGPESVIKAPTKDEKEFARLIDSDSVWYWAKELENKIERLETELKKAYSEDVSILRRKAALYDKFREDVLADARVN